jgi:hypothetical protein
MQNSTRCDAEVADFLKRITPVFQAADARANGAAAGGRLPQGESWSAALEQVQRLQSLGADWDGQGAQAPSPVLLESARQLAEVLARHAFPPPCRVVAGPDGEVLLEWQAGDAYLEAEIGRPGTAEWLLILPDQTSQHGEMSW